MSDCPLSQAMAVWGSSAATPHTYHKRSSQLVSVEVYTSTERLRVSPEYPVASYEVASGWCVVVWVA